MKITNLLKSSLCCLCSSAFLIFTVFLSNDIVYAAPQNVQLSFDSVEVDIASVAADRTVRVPVNISNNPGFKQLIFNVEKDPKLLFSQQPSENPFELKSGIDSVDFTFFSNSDNVVRGVFNAAGIYTDNNSFTSVAVMLPDNVAAGDEFNLSFNGSYIDSDGNYYTYGIDVDDGNGVYNDSVFSTGLDTRIKIVDASAVSDITSVNSDNFEVNKYSFSGDVKYGLNSEDDAEDEIFSDDDLITKSDEKLNFRVNHVESFEGDKILEDVKYFNGDAELVSCFIIVSFSVVVALIALILFRVSQLKKKENSAFSDKKKKKK